MEAGRRNQIPGAGITICELHGGCWELKMHSGRTVTTLHLGATSPSLKRFQLSMSLSRFNPIVSRGLFVLGYLVCLLYFGGTESHHISSSGGEHDVLLS